MKVLNAILEDINGKTTSDGPIPGMLKTFADRLSGFSKARKPIDKLNLRLRVARNLSDAEDLLEARVKELKKMKAENLDELEKTKNGLETGALEVSESDRDSMLALLKSGIPGICKFGVNELTNYAIEDSEKLFAREVADGASMRQARVSKKPIEEAMENDGLTLPTKKMTDKQYAAAVKKRDAWLAKHGMVCNVTTSPRVTRT